jgi:polyisoprenoid-binding protein YceI
LKKHYRWTLGGLALLALFIFSLLLYNQWFGFGGIQSGDAIAPTLESTTTNQPVYQIDTSQSLVRYEVTERFVGRDLSTAIGITRQIAGNILVDSEVPSRIQIGTIVINIEQFESDSGLRDRRIRREFLESERYPEATFVTTDIMGLPTNLQERTPYNLEIIGDLTIKETTQTVTWVATVTLDGDVLTGTASTTLLMSDYAVGPISIVGLVETSNEVVLTFEFVAQRVAPSSSIPTETSTSKP